MYHRYREPIESFIKQDETRAFISYRSGSSGQMAAEHWHECVELLYVFGGAARQTVNSETMILKPKDALLIASGDLHATQSITADCYIGVAQFYTDMPCRSIRLCANEAPPQFESIFTSLSEETSLCQPEYKMVMQGLIWQAVGLLLRFGTPVSNLYPLTAEAMKITEYIQSHMFDGITLSKTAKFAGYSESYFSHYFRQQIGVSFRSYLETAKMNAAKKCLIEGKSVSDVSNMLQYESLSSFSRAFKKSFGCSPGSYLKQQMNKKS